MKIEEYLSLLPPKKKLSEVKLKILKRLWCDESDGFPKPWVSSDELLQLTGQKYFDRRTREIRDQLGCDLESSYQAEFSGHAWRVKSDQLATPQDRDYLTQAQKKFLFESNEYTCATCGLQVDAGIRGLQADHKIPISREGSNDLDNWQPMCNNCNVGKRRACEGCEIDCKICSWAFPETVGVPTLLSINEVTLRRLDKHSKLTGESKNMIMEEAVAYFLDSK